MIQVPLTDDILDALVTWFNYSAPDERKDYASAQIQTHDSPRSRSLPQADLRPTTPDLNHLTASEH
jgi:hypothetical protein